jgi:preprotein translocase subunit SecF
VLAAVLAVLGYSVNESVVIFDRIREVFRRQRKMGTREVIDRAITSTMSRTIITHGSTEVMVLSMLFFGGPTLHYFALA